MKIDKKELKDEILKLAFDLEKQYLKLNFKHHCYLRIAYDNVIKQKWNNVIEPPFLDNATFGNLINVYSLLISYLSNEKVLQVDNQNSLNYRKK